MSDTLKFGYNAGIPEGTPAAWGARWIYPNDQLVDRTDMFGTDEAKAPLFTWLRDTVKGQPFEYAREHRYTDLPESNEDRECILYEDEIGIMKANPQASYGYLYVCAYLKETA